MLRGSGLRSWCRRTTRWCGRRSILSRPCPPTTMSRPAPGSRTTALLMLGWLADRLDWTLVKAEANPVFRNSLGQLLTVVIREIPGNSISRILLRSKDACFELSRKEGSDVFVTSVKDESLSTSSRMVMTRRDETGDILLAELARGGRHPLYCKAVQAVQKLWD